MQGGFPCSSVNGRKLELVAEIVLQVFKLDGLKLQGIHESFGKLIKMKLLDLTLWSVAQKPVFSIHAQRDAVSASGDAVGGSLQTIPLQKVK